MRANRDGFVGYKFLLAMVNAKDRNHSRVLKAIQRIDEPLVLPVTVLPEICNLIGTRLGHKSIRQFLNSVISTSIPLET